VRLKPDGTRWRTGGEVKGKLANAVGSQYSSHCLRTWCIQHYYRWCAHLGSQQSTELTPQPIKMDSFVSAKNEYWFLLVCHHISNALYHHTPEGISWIETRYYDCILPKLPVISWPGPNKPYSLLKTRPQKICNDKTTAAAPASATTKTIITTTKTTTSVAVWPCWKK